MGLRVEVRSLGEACRVVVHLDEGRSGTQGERVDPPELLSCVRRLARGDRLGDARFRIDRGNEAFG
jgi:hypothetical protein